MSGEITSSPDGRIDAARQQPGPGQTGYGVHLISNSNGSPFYTELRRRALDYAYGSCVVSVSSKGNELGDTRLDD